MNPVILTTMAKILFPWVLLFSLYLLARGHQSIGGGFIAGVMAALALALLYIAWGRQYVRRFLPWNPLYLVAAGLLLAVGTGLPSIVLGFPFLTSAFVALHLPFFGEIKLASPSLFDVGVFITVVGALLTIISTIGGEEWKP